MTLEKIENHIVDEATTKAAELAETTRTEAAETVSNAKQQADADLALGIDRLKAELKNAFDQSIGTLQAEQRLEMLKLKTAILDDVFEQATRKLLFDDGYWQLTRRYLRSMAGQKGEILCRSEHRETLGRAIDELNAEVTEKIPPLSEETVDILGGFILRGDKFDVDYSLDSQLETFRTKVLPELMAEAFPEAS